MTMAKYKKIFIPGWMDTVKNRVDFNGIDIWKGNFDLNQKIDAEYLIGHSAGANYAIVCWKNNRDTKLILVNPGIAHENFFGWVYRMMKFWIFEGTKMSKERMSCLKYFFSSFSNVLKFLKIDLMPILLEIPKENLAVIRGQDDRFIFSKKIADELKSKGINVIEIDGAGHNWNKKFEEEINKIIK
jgi:hypothetical protein